MGKTSGDFNRDPSFTNANLSPDKRIVGDQTERRSDNTTAN